MTLVSLATEYGVSASVIWRIQKGKSYAYIPQEAALKTAKGTE